MWTANSLNHLRTRGHSMQEALKEQREIEGNVEEMD